MGIFDRFRRRQRERPAEDDAPGLFTARSGAVPPELGGTRRDGTTADEDLWDRPAPASEPVPEPEAEPVAERVAEVDPVAEEPEVEALTAFDPEPPAPADHVEHTEAVEAPPTPVWDESTWEDDEAADAGEHADVAVERPADLPLELPEDGGSTADEPLFGAYEDAPEPVPPPATDPVPPLFEHPPVEAEPAPTDLVDTPPPTPEQPDLVVETHPEVIAPEEPDSEPGPVSAGSGPPPREESAAEAADRTMRVHEERLDKRPGPIQMTPSEAIRLAQDGPRAARRLDHPGA